jgi:copper chaperone CopZ
MSTSPSRCAGPSRLRLTGALLLAALAGCAAAEPVRPEFADPTPIAGADEVVLGVHGLSCPLCANNVGLQLESVPGVREVSVDMSQGLVRVALSPAPRPSRLDLARAVQASGFTLVSLELR